MTILLVVNHLADILIVVVGVLGGSDMPGTNLNDSLWKIKHKTCIKFKVYLDGINEGPEAEKNKLFSFKAGLLFCKQCLKKSEIKKNQWPDLTNTNP